jgi:hypothetical protein
LVSAFDPEEGYETEALPSADIELAVNPYKHWSIRTAKTAVIAA